jgi:hypothetical protein
MDTPAIMVGAGAIVVTGVGMVATGAAAAAGGALRDTRTFRSPFLTSISPTFVSLRSWAMARTRSVSMPDTGLVAEPAGLPDTALPPFTLLTGLVTPPVFDAFAAGAFAKGAFAMSVQSLIVIGADATDAAHRAETSVHRRRHAGAF